VVQSHRVPLVTGGGTGIGAADGYAGRGGAPGSLLEVDPTKFEAVHRVNVVGALLTAQAAIPHLLERRGAIVSVASVAGLQAVACRSRTAPRRRRS
jgi:NAD(P)-dependent dehydrogenase (short-subunit alcohol dehydrogenase family)